MRRWLLAEALLLTVLAAAAGAALAAQAGHWGWSWDALNHHVYLGLVAEHPRWHLDVAAASNQSYQYPYLYWPVYRVALLEGQGRTLAMAWAAVHAALVTMPVWLLSHRLLARAGQPHWEQAATRAAACTFALLNGVLLLSLSTTANDLLAALPLVWAVAIHLGNPLSTRRAAWCGALFGISVAFKWSNGLAIPLLLFWWWRPVAPRLPLLRGLAIGVGAVAGFAVAYVPWGLQVWQATGNPFHPFFHAWFGR